jgi:uncharacterized protein
MFSQIVPKILLLITFFILLFIYTKIAGPLPLTINSTSTTKSTTFDVSGTGKATATPDFATARGGVSFTGQTVALVQDQINTTSNKMSTALKQVGIDPKDIQTSNYNINPTYDYTKGSQRITGYSANTTFTVKVRDINKVGQAIDAMTSAGATNVSNLGFEVTDKTAALNEARKQAVNDAKKKAADAASIAGFQLGKIVNYSESFGDYPRPVYALDMAGGGNASQKTSVEPGTNDINLTVTLSYEIK